MFRTEVKVAQTDLDLSLQDKVLTVGSCFATVIGDKLQQHKVDALVNPFGTLFNPLSVCSLLSAAAKDTGKYSPELVQRDGIWYAYDLHSSLSSPHKEELLQLVQSRMQETKAQLQQSSLLVITLGTAIAYRLRQTGEVVANCHKLPASLFERVLLPIGEMQTAFEQMLDHLKQANPSLKVILTVSPVRHIKETIELNSVSKASLRVLCHQLQQAHEEVLYFPAYEIMMDDLRDYRFYKEDMLHPSALAEDYIWQKFVDACYAPAFRQFMQEWEKLQRAVAHRPFHPEAEAHQQFVQRTLQQLQALEQKYNIKATQEKESLRQQLLPKP
ncbi:GSCFA domain-containing protein [Pontibacter mangrovi]|uniref:GSCFA domain-containing protein n=1 Tax=Pontibacter mangrovi TaxID=2589816 RepID=A0A501VZV9_9BACT|nr:GSCFA domain-containing protein [Pontibacter mangrovi]TPE42578.1 GSCFA domain-containing protein [Pontibacter mangrovi]